MKIIQINTFSHSLLMMDFEKDIYKNWYAQVAFKLKEEDPNLDIECWTPERKYKKEEQKEVNGVKFRIFPSTFCVRHGMDISIPLVKALLEEQKKLKGDEKLIIHIHGYHSWLSYLILSLIKKRNARIFAQHHGDKSPFKNMRKYKRMALFLPAVILMQFAENMFFKKIDVFYSLSDEERGYLKNIAPKSKIKFQTMGIEDKNFAIESKNKARKKLGLSLDKKYIIYLGRIKTTKGIKELLDAMPQIEDKTAELILIGEGSDYKKYKDYAAKKNIANANFVGAKYGDEKLDYLTAGDCLILPSHTEGAPVVLMEAIAKNLLVIATDVGGIPKMIKNGREGIIIKVKSREDIISSINQILKWRKKNIRKYANVYKWKSIIKATLKDYKDEAKR